MAKRKDDWSFEIINLWPLKSGSLSLSLSLVVFRINHVDSFERARAFALVITQYRYEFPSFVSGNAIKAFERMPIVE